MRRAVAVLVCALAGCAGSQVFSLTAADNDPAAVARALAAAAPAAAPRRAVVYLALDDGMLAAWDLAAARALWSVPAVARSRVVVAGSYIALREGDALVARDAADGRRLWTRRLSGALTGLAADRERVYTVERERGAWRIAALGRDGHELWNESSTGRVGAPTADRGLLYLPFLEQWLTILDGASGAPLARVRQEDEAISWARATADGVFYGAHSVILLDERSATGRRAKERSLAPRLPGLAHRLAGPDAYDPAGVAYSALDRTRLLWSAARAGDGLAFRDGLVVLLAQRYLFALDAGTGVVRWARAQADVVAAEDSGAALLVVAGNGEIAALDRATGARLGTAAAGARVLGATFDARGFRPAAEPGAAAAPAGPVDDVLAAIATDRDARFGPAKRFAAAALARRPGRAATAALLRVLSDDAALADVRAAAGDALIAGTDPEGTPPLVAALATHSDYATGKAAPAVGVLARALAARGATEAGPALVAHLVDPATSAGTRRTVADALVAIHSAGSVPALESFLLLHRCDPRWSRAGGAEPTVVDALIALGGAREVLRWTADEPRTAPALASYIRAKLGE